MSSRNEGGVAMMDTPGVRTHHSQRHVLRVRPTGSGELCGMQVGEVEALGR